MRCTTELDNFNKKKFSTILSNIQLAAKAHTVQVNFAWGEWVVWRTELYKVFHAVSFQRSDWRECLKKLTIILNFS